MRIAAAFFVGLTLAAPLAAQLPDGATAPDFEATDLAGQAWHLYDLLDQGKIVVLDISATSCPPCWAYHQSQALEDFYTAHGPSGDDRARVFFVEGDPATPPACLAGPDDCATYTPGNWFAGASFPFINDDVIATSYAVTYFPGIYIVCPNRKAFAVGPLSSDALWDAAQACPVAAGTNNAGLFYADTGSPFHEVCDSLPLAPSVRLINLGSAALHEAKIQLRWNGEPVQTVAWSGTLPLYGEADVAFDSLHLAGAGTLETRLISVNNAADDDDPAHDLRSASFTVANTGPTTQVVLKLRTDAYGAETYWEIRGEAGAVLAHGGNLAVGAAGGAAFPGGVTPGPGAYGNLVAVKDTIELPGPGCYSLHLVDGYGDGMCCQYGVGYYRLYSLDDAVTPLLAGGAFTAYEERVFGAGVFGVGTGEPVAAAPEVVVYPNPAHDVVTVALDVPAQEAIVYDAVGRPVARDFSPALRYDFAVGNWRPGAYWVVLRLGKTRIVRMFLVE
jgi:hypothetical protein